MGECRYSLMHAYPQHEMKVNGQLHALSALFRGKSPRKFILVLSSHLYFGIKNGCFTKCFPTKIRSTFVISLIITIRLDQRSHYSNNRSTKWHSITHEVILLAISVWLLSYRSFLWCTVWEKRGSLYVHLTWHKWFGHHLPNFRRRQINNFPGVVSSRGTYFVFAIIHDAPFGRHMAKWMGLSY